MSTITIDLNDVKGASDAVAALSNALSYTPGAAATDDWITRATASTQLGFPAHFRSDTQPTFSILIDGVVDTQKSMAMVNAISAVVASVNSRAVNLTGFPVVTLSLSS
jgi:hypothetical protein